MSPRRRSSRLADAGREQSDSPGCHNALMTVAPCRRNAVPRRNRPASIVRSGSLDVADAGRQGPTADGKGKRAADFRKLEWRLFVRAKKSQAQWIGAIAG